MKTLKEMIAGGKKVTLVRYQSQELIYVTECGFEFPVPISETGTAVFLPEDRAAFFMSWIRKQIDLIEGAKKEQKQGVRSSAG